MLTVFKTILTSKKQLNNNIYLFTFKLLDPLEISFIPGQNLILKVQNRPRLYSIYSSNKTKNLIEFIVGIIPGGLASTYFLNLKIGDQAEFQGPLGQFVLKENENKKMFLATGTGIAPVLSILESHTIQATLYTLYWGLRTYKDVYLFDQVKKFNPKICLSREQNLEMIPELDKNYFDLGHVDQVMEKNLFTDKLQITDYEFYLCGGKSAVESLRLGLLAKGINQENIFFEKF